MLESRSQVSWGTKIRTSAAVALSLTLALAGGTEASAQTTTETPGPSETSIVVGPIRQLLTTNNEPVVVYVANLSDGPMTITTTTALGDTRAVFTPSNVALSVQPATFRLKAGEQRTVLVTKTGPIRSPLAAVVFTVVPDKQPGTGVLVRGQVLAQFTVHPTALTGPAATETSFPWWLIGIVALGLGIGYVGVRAIRNRDQRRYRRAASTYR